jgi:hypothetical protein
MAQGSNSSNEYVNRGASEAMYRLKLETAAELGLPNYNGYHGELPSRMNGAVGGHMVRKMIRLAEGQLSGGTAR